MAVFYYNKTTNMLNELEHKFHTERRLFWENRLNLKHVVAYSKISVTWYPTANVLEIPKNIVFSDYCENPTENKHKIDCDFYPAIYIQVITTYPQTTIHFWCNNKDTFITYPKIEYDMRDFMRFWCKTVTNQKTREHDDFAIYVQQKMMWLFLLTFYDFYATTRICERLLDAEYVVANDYLVMHVIKY